MASYIGPKTGGYDHKFVSEPSEDLKCSICLCVAKDPLQHGEEGCGKIFCRSCITEYRKTNNKCPNCRRRIVTFKDVRSERDIQSLRVECEKAYEGCEWIGELRSLEDHLHDCGYTLLPCPNECELEEVYRKDLEKHLTNECPRRQHACPHCKETGEYEDIMGFYHLDECPKLETECSNALECQVVVLREDLPSHLSTCPYQEVHCKFREFGCEAKPIRKDIQDHEKDDQLHLHITMEKVLTLKRKCEELTPQVQNVCKIVSNHIPAEQTARLTFKMNHFTENKKADTEFSSPPFYTHPGGYKMTINIYANGYDDCEGTHVSVWAYLMRGEYDDQLEFPFKGTVTFELLNQLEDNNHHRSSRTITDDDDYKRVIDEHRADSAQGVCGFIPHANLERNVTKNCQYLKDNCLVFRIYVKVPSYKPWLQCTVQYTKP